MKLGVTQKVIFTFLTAAAGTFYTKAEIAEGTGLDADKIRKSADRMVSSGVLVKDADKRYSLAEKLEQPAPKAEPVVSQSPSRTYALFRKAGDGNVQRVF